MHETEVYRLLRKLRTKYMFDKNEQRARVRNEQLTRVAGHFGITYLNSDKNLREFTEVTIKTKKKKYRTNRFLRGMFEMYHELWFVTLTFTDEAMTKTNSEALLRRQARHFLAENTRCYYANEDYGAENERYHIHAVVALNQNARAEDLAKAWRRLHGSLNFARVKKGKIDRLRISSYITKLTNHAGKYTSGIAFHSRGLVETDLDIELPF